MSDTLTRLIIEGDDDEIDQFMKDVKGETNLDFNKIILCAIRIKIYNLSY